MITPNAEIIHLVGAASTSKVGTRILVTEVRVILIRDHWPRWQVPLGIGLMWLWGATRITASRLLALAGRTRDKERLAYWSEVWQRRAEWLHGY